MSRRCLIRRLLVPFALAIVALLPASRGWAASCTITNSNISFGAYDPLSGQPRDTNGVIQNTCEGTSGENVSYSISLTELSGNGSSLTLSNGNTRLDYNLYLDLGRTVIWGNGANGSSLIQDSFNLTSGPVNRNYTVYGRIYGGQVTATAGAYSDSLMITINY